ncbi:MAG: class I SAM-dependent methyltransferase [Bacteroidota bacterium]
MYLSRNAFFPFFFYGLIVLLTIVLLQGCSGCTQDYPDGGTFHHSQQTHDYRGTNKPMTRTEELLEEYERNLKENTDNIDIRDIWQKPEVVLDLLGNLDGKVVADIGAGPYGYFSLRIASRTKAEKVIAIDINQEALDHIEEYARALFPETGPAKLEPRLATDNDPMLKPGEADVILIVNTTIYFKNRLQYFENLQRGLAIGGHLMVIDYKKKKTPIGPPLESRIALGQLESDLVSSGYELISSDDKTLEFQYIITAMKRE